MIPNMMLHEDILQMVMNVDPANYRNLGRHLRFRCVCKTWDRVSKPWLRTYVDNIKKCANSGLYAQYMVRDIAGLLNSIDLYPFNPSISIAAIDFLMRTFHENNSSSRDIVRKGGIAVVSTLILLNKKQWKGSNTIYFAVLMLWTFCSTCKENEINIIEMAHQNTIGFMIDVVEKSENIRVIEMGFDIINKLCYRSEHCQKQALLKDGVEIISCKIKNRRLRSDIVKAGCRLIGTMSCITMPPVNIARSSAIGILVTCLKKNNMEIQKHCANVLLKLQKNKHNKQRIARALGASTIRSILQNQHTHDIVRRKCLRLHKFVFKK